MPDRHQDGDSEFTLCMRCGSDLRRSLGTDAWEEVPAEQKVARRQRELGDSASAVAGRMQHPAPRRRHLRDEAPVTTRGQRRARPHRAGIAALLEVTGRYVIDSVVEQLRRPADPLPSDALLPAPPPTRAVSRSRARSRLG